MPFYRAWKAGKTSDRDAAAKTKVDREAELFNRERELYRGMEEQRDDVREELSEEQRLRQICERRVDRFLDALRFWSGLAHDMRHGRMNDRQKHMSFEHSAGIEPLVLPDVMMLPPLAELDE